MTRTGRPLLLFMTVVFGGPLLVVLAYAFSSGWTFPQVAPDQFDLRAVGYLLDQADVLTDQVLASIAYSLLTALLTFIICLAPARALAGRAFAGRSLIEGLLLAPAVAPSMTFSMGVHFLFIKFGLADNLTGVVLVLTIFSYPYMLRALTAGYQAFGSGYGRCATNLGAGPWHRFRRVELPLLLPAALAGGTVVFLVAYSEYFLVFLIGGGSVPSLAVYVFPFLNSSDRSTASLLTLVFIAAPLIMFLILELTVNRLYRRKGMI